MWPLHARSKDEYVQLIQTYLEKQQKEPLQETIAQAFDDYDGEEDFAAWLASVAYGTELPYADRLLVRFIDRFPLSHHPIQVDMAESLVWQGKVDSGANEARAWLNRLHQADLFEQFASNDLIRDGVSRAFLLITSIYTELGARSYSRRVLETAMMLRLEPYWQKRYATEHMRLDEEMRQSAIKAADAKWEQFFRIGEAAGDLAYACEVKGAPLLQKRVEVIARNFEEDRNFRVSDDEIFQLLYQTDKGAFVLV
jgi:hypothetical protein